MTDVMERVKTYRQFIGGEFVESASGETLEIENPANGQVIATVPASSPEDVDRAVEAADTAFQSWKNTTPQDRSLLLLKIADALEARADELGRLESANAGKPVGAAIDEMTVCVDLFRFFAGAARIPEGLAATEYLAGHTSIIRRDPIGVVASHRAVELPAVHGHVEARAGAGGRQHRACSSRRSGRRSRALAFAETLAEHLPPGVVNVISGSGNAIGDHLVGHPKVRMVSITGDTATGKRVAKIAAETVKRLHLELGGKAPVIIFDDADLDLAAETLKAAGYWNAGPGLHGGDPRPRRPGGVRRVRRASWPTRSARSSGATRPRRTTSTWARSSPRPRRTRCRAWSTARASSAQRWSWAATDPTGRAPTTSRRSSPARTRSREIIQDEIFGPVVTVQRFSDEEQAVRGRTTRPTGWPPRCSRRTSAGRCASPRRSSSGTSGSTSTSRSRRRRRTVA